MKKDFPKTYLFVFRLFAKFFQSTISHERTLSHSDVKEDPFGNQTNCFALQVKQKFYGRKTAL